MNENPSYCAYFNFNEELNDMVVNTYNFSKSFLELFY